MDKEPFKLEGVTVKFEFSNESQKKLQEIKRLLNKSNELFIELLEYDPPRIVK